MLAILHTRSGNKLRVDIKPKQSFDVKPRHLLEREITYAYNKSGMIDKVIRTEIPLFNS